MITDTRDRIIDYIRYHGQARVYDLQKELQISSVAIHRQLNKLLQKDLIVRLGKPPVVFYTLPPEEVHGLTENLKLELLSLYSQQTIEANFLSITPDGKLLYGIKGFEYWVQRY